MIRFRRSDRDGQNPEATRSSRFEEREDGWYFRTREGIAVGPYATRFDAE